MFSFARKHANDAGTRPKSLNARHLVSGKGYFSVPFTARERLLAHCLNPRDRLVHITPPPGKPTTNPYPAPTPGRRGGTRDTAGRVRLVEIASRSDIMAVEGL